MTTDQNPYLTDDVVTADDLSGEFGYKDALEGKGILGGATTTPFAPGSFLNVSTQRANFFGKSVAVSQSTTRALAGEHSFNEYVAGLNTMTPDELQNLQLKLYYSGAYEDSVYKEGRLPSGMLDGETVKAYLNVLTVASREVGRGRTIADVLDQMATDRADVVNAALSAFDGGDDESFPTAQVSVSDPATLSDLVEKAGRAVLGRKVTEAQKQKMIAAIQGSEVGEQTKSIAASDANRQRAADAKGGAAAGTSSGEATFNEKMAEMSAAAKAEGFDVKVAPGGGKRTHQQQAKLYAEKPNLAAKPGNSNHEYGLAADLTFGNDAARKWAHANAARFGLTFPMLGEHGGKNEPWHVELINAKAQRNTAAYDTTHVIVPGMPSLHGDGSMEPTTLPNGAAPPAAGVAGSSTTVNPTQVVTETQVDPAARIEDMVRATNPTLAAAHDSVSKYALFAKILGGA